MATTQEQQSVEELGAEVSSSVLTPLRFLERSAAVWKDRPAVVSGKRTLDLRRALRARPPRRRAPCARSSASRHGDRLAVLLPNVAPMLELHLRRARRRRRAGAAQHAPRLARVRLHPRALRREGAGRLPAAAEGARPGARGARRRRAAGRLGRGGRRRGLRLRAAARRRRPDRPRAPRGRARADLDQLHLGHDRPPEGRHDQPPRRLPARAGRDRRGPPDAALELPVDAPDVPLQRLGVSVGGHRDGRQARLPAEGRGQADLERADQGGRDPPVRRADRADDDRRRRRGRAARERGVRLRGRRAAVADAARAGRQAEAADHPPLRADRDLRAARGVRLEPRLGRARRRRAGQAALAPGRRHRRQREAARRRRGHAGRARRRRDARRGLHARRQRDDGLLPATRTRRARRSRAAGSTPATSASCTRTATSSCATASRT